MDAYMRAIWSYVPGRYRGRVLVLWPEENPCPPHEVKAAWRHVARQVEVRSVPGDHHTAMTRHVDAVAEQIRLALRDEGRQPPSATA